MQQIISLEDGTEVNVKKRFLIRPSGNRYRRRRHGSWCKQFYVTDDGEWISYAHIDPAADVDDFGDPEEKPVTDKSRVSSLNRLWKAAKEEHRKRIAAHEEIHKKIPRVREARQDEGKAQPASRSRKAIIYPSTDPKYSLKVVPYPSNKYPDHVVLWTLQNPGGGKGKYYTVQRKEAIRQTEKLLAWLKSL
jgi:hypothetical protein